MTTRDDTAGAVVCVTGHGVLLAHHQKSSLDRWMTTMSAWHSRNISVVRRHVCLKARQHLQRHWRVFGNHLGHKDDENGSRWNTAGEEHRSRTTKRTKQNPAGNAAHAHDTLVSGAGIVRAGRVLNTAVPLHDYCVDRQLKTKKDDAKQ